MRGQTSNLPNPYFYFVFLFPYNPKHTHTHYSSVAPGDYGNLTNFRLGPFNTSVRQLSFNVSIMDDNITEDAEMFSASLTLEPAVVQAELVGNVTVSPDVATATIVDSDGKIIDDHTAPKIWGHCPNGQ